MLWNGDDEELTGQLLRGELTADAYEGELGFVGWHRLGLYVHPTIWLKSRANVSAYDAIEFYAKSDKEGQEFYFAMRDWHENGGGLVGQVFMNDYVEGGALTTQWRRVVIPFAAFITAEFDATQMTHFNFRALGEGDQGVPNADRLIFCDQVRAIRYADE